MAVAVEHASKAYLASIAPVLLASEKQPSVDDLLVLSGNEDRTKKGRAGLKTIGGEGAILRAAQLLGPEHKAPAKLKELRESRNGITHMGWGQPVTECRALLAGGIEHINALLRALSTGPDGFWGTHLDACTALVAEAMTEMEIRYNAKLRQARERFAETTRRLSEAEITELVSSLSALPTAALGMLTIPAGCPACGHTGFTRPGQVWRLRGGLVPPTRLRVPPVRSHTHEVGTRPRWNQEPDAQRRRRARPRLGTRLRDVLRAQADVPPLPVPHRGNRTTRGAAVSSRAICSARASRSVYRSTAARTRRWSSAVSSASTSRCTGAQCRNRRTKAGHPGAPRLLSVRCSSPRPVAEARLLGTARAVGEGLVVAPLQGGVDLGLRRIHRGIGPGVDDAR